MYPTAIKPAARIRPRLDFALVKGIQKALLRHNFRVVGEIAHDVRLVFPLVERLVELHAAFSQQRVDHSDVGDIAILLKLLPNPPSDLRDGHVEVVELDNVRRLMRFRWW